MVILELIHVPKPYVLEGLCLSDTEPTHGLPGIVVIHNDQTTLLFQRLGHACLSIRFYLGKLRMAH